MNRRIARGSRRPRVVRNAHVGEQPKTHPTLDKVRRLDLPGKARDAAAAATRWAKRKHSRTHLIKALEYGLRIARGVRDGTRKWTATLDNLGPLVELQKPDFAAKVKAVKDAAADMDARITAVAVVHKELRSIAAVPVLKMQTAPIKVAPGALRDLMVSVEPTVSAFIASLSLIENLGGLAWPMPSLDPILKMGKELGEALVKFARWMRNVAAGVGVALLLIAALLFTRNSRRWR